MITWFSPSGIPGSLVFYTKFHTLHLRRNTLCDGFKRDSKTNCYVLSGTLNPADWLTHFCITTSSKNLCNNYSRHYVIARFGHQDKITGIDVLSQERVVTSGARDGSVRIWKIVEESQLVFHGHRLVIVCCFFSFSSPRYKSGALCNGDVLFFCSFVSLFSAYMLAGQLPDWPRSASGHASCEHPECRWVSQPVPDTLIAVGAYCVKIVQILIQRSNFDFSRFTDIFIITY